MIVAYAAVDVLRVLAIVLTILSVAFLIGWNYEYKKHHLDIACPRGFSISYALFALVTAIELQLRLGTPATWRTPIAFAAAMIGIATQVVTFFHWKRTYAAQRPSSTGTNPK